MPTKEQHNQLVASMKAWQRIESSTIAATSTIMDETSNPIVELVMSIIQHDSQLHHRVQGWIAASLEEATVSLSPDELGVVWELIEKHRELERKTVEIATEALAATKGKGMLVQEYFLKYLLQDEQKHDDLLERLDKLKGGMYP